MAKAKINFQFPVSLIAPIKLKDDNLFFNNINLLISNAKKLDNFEIILLVNTTDESNEIKSNIKFKNLTIIVYETKYQSNRYNRLLDIVRGKLIVFFSYDIKISNKFWDEILINSTKDPNKKYFQAAPFNSHLNIHPIIKSSFINNYKNIIFKNNLFLFYCVDTWISFLISSTYYPEKISNIELIHEHTPNIDKKNYKVAIIDIFSFFLNLPFLINQVHKKKINKIDYFYLFKILIVLMIDFLSALKNYLKKLLIEKLNK